MEIEDLADWRNDIRPGRPRPERRPRDPPQTRPGYHSPVSPRPTPYDLVFAGMAEERFPPIRAALEAAGKDARDRDAFLLTGPAVELVHDLRPDEPLGEGIDRLAALVHHAYLFWDAGAQLVSLDRPALDRLLSLDPGAPPLAPAAVPYVQLPERIIWAQPLEDEAFEPLDGWFDYLAPDGALRTLAVFGLHPDRMGFTVVEAIGGRPHGLARPGGSPLFAPAMPGGDLAGLRSIIGPEELLELAWRARGAGDAH